MATDQRADFLGKWNPVIWIALVASVLILWPAGSKSSKKKRSKATIPDDAAPKKRIDKKNYYLEGVVRTKSEAESIASRLRDKGNSARLQQKGKTWLVYAA